MGSITSWFQREAIISRDGTVNTDGRLVDSEQVVGGNSTNHVGAAARAADSMTWEFVQATATSIVT